MANKHSLKAETRKVTGRRVKQLRATGQIPANVFGKGVTSATIQVDDKQFKSVFAEVGESTLVYLQVEGEKEARPVLVRDVTVHPVTGQILHVDFHQVNLKEKVTAPVTVKLVGEAPAEKEKLGILVQQLDEVEIEALPTDMPEHLDVSVDGLVAVNDAITVGDLIVDSAKLTVKSDPEAIIVKIEALAAEEPVEAPVAEGEAPVEDAGAPAEGEATTEPTAQPEEKKE